MTSEKFCDLMLGKPWRRWCADFDACDCFGLFLLYSKHVMGLDYGLEVPKTDFVTGAAMADLTQSEEPAHGLMFISGGAHCGVVLPDCKRVIHCQGSDQSPGNVRIDRIRAIEKIYGEVKFYAYNQSKRAA